MPQKRFAVIGHPIGHTMSPYIHQKLLKLCGVNGTYAKMDIPPQELAERFTDTLRLLDGFNVTIPHKQAVIPLLDELDGDAAAFGSVNTVSLRGGKAAGCTTDGIGFRRALSAAGLPVKGRVLLLGTGGVARVLANEIQAAPNWNTLYIVMRRHEDERPHATDTLRQAQERQARRAAREQAFLNSLNRRLQAPDKKDGAALSRKICITDEETVEQSCADGLSFDLLVNGTSAGMYPNLADCPVSAQTVRACHAVFDAVYNPGVTMLMHYAQEAGIPCAGGMGMLVWQAAASEEIWLKHHFAPQEVAPIVADAEQTMRRRFGNVILCGFMGCGKSTAGRLLAQSLGREFVDLDTFIERKEGMSISDLFREKGEAYFRRCETEACRTLSRRSGLVLAAGGGTLLHPENTRLLRETGVIALLHTPYESIAQRLSGDHSRPLLERADKVAFMRSLYETRMPVYQSAADLTVQEAQSDAAAQKLQALLTAEADNSL